MSRFLSPLRMEFWPGGPGEPESDTNTWILIEPLIYESDVAKRTITVPAGFRTDLASTPRIPVLFELFGNVAHRAAVVHDYLYTSGRESRSIADAVMREACGVTGVPAWRSWGMWLGVRLGGAGRYTDKPGGSPVTDPDAVPAAIDNVLY